MKKTHLALLGGALLLATAACGTSEEAASADGSDRQNLDAGLAIQGNTRSCADADLAWCVCPGGDWSVQECRGGAWGNCACGDASADESEESSPAVDDAAHVFGGIFISEYIEGSSNNKAVEVHNASSAKAACALKLYTNGSATPGSTVEFTIDAGGTGAFCNGGASGALKERCFAASAVASFNGDDALELVCDGATVDVFGSIGTRPSGGAWTQGEASTKDKTLRRKPEVYFGQTSTDAAFSALAKEWEVLPIDTFDGIGAHVLSGAAEVVVPVEPSEPETPVVPETPVEPETPVVPETPVEPETPAEMETPTPKAEWTFMVYVNGDNNLYEYAASDVKEMQKITKVDSVNVIVLYDDYGRNNTKLYRITPGSKELLDSGSAIFSGSEADMGDWKTLRNFGVWAVNNYPAKRYALIMWNHGGGWKAEGEESRLFKDFSNDEYGTYDGILISKGEYAKALAPIVEAAGQKMNLLGFDACLMAMYEVATVSALYGDYLVGSEETEPANGWSYDYFLPKLGKKPTMDAEELGKAIVDGYYDYATDNVTLALMDLSTMPALHTAISSFANQLKGAGSSDKTVLKSIRSNLMEFAVEEHVDLMNFAEKVQAKSFSNASIKSTASALIAQLNDTIVYNKSRNYYDSYYRQYFYYGDNANGMAIYYPTKSSAMDSDYTKGAGALWTDLSTWHLYLKSL